MRVLITGAGGQLGRELVRTAPAAATVRALDRTYLDVTDAAAVQAVVGEYQPTVILNAAGYTAVDRAESDQEAAWRLNAVAPRQLAEAARTVQQCRLIHVSTDYVFDGESPRPYQPQDAPNPLSAYGKSKLEGERAVLEVLGNHSVVVRTAWVYSAHGRNFLHTMLRLMREQGVVRVVADQIGSPTATASLAVLSESIWRRRFAASSAVLGRSILVNGVPSTVIGVMPPGFRGWQSVPGACPGGGAAVGHGHAHRADAASARSDRAARRLAVDSERAVARAWSPRPIDILVRISLYERTGCGRPNRRTR